MLLLKILLVINLVSLFVASFYAYFFEDEEFDLSDVIKFIVVMITVGVLVDLFIIFALLFDDHSGMKIKTFRRKTKESIKNRPPSKGKS